MKITDIKIHILEQDEPRAEQYMFEIPNQLGVKFDRRSRPVEGKARFPFIRILTDAGIEGWSTGWYGAQAAEAFSEQLLEAYKVDLIGKDPLDREYIWQMLWYADRFKWVPRWRIGYLDVALWDIAGKYAKLPINKLIGGFRQRVPAYLSSPNFPEIGDFVRQALAIKEAGCKGYKLHSRLGPDKDIQVARAVREAVGPGFYLMHDPVQTYTFSEALRVGRALEELDYYWLEEPLQDYEVINLKKLSDALDIPVIATEVAFGAPYTVAQFLAQGAVDAVRGDAIVSSGITGLLKVAHLAESFSLNCEVHLRGPIFGFAHAHVLAAIRNCDFFEFNPPHPLESALVRNPLTLEDGHVAAPTGPGLGIELDWDELERRTVKVL